MIDLLRTYPEFARRHLSRGLASLSKTNHPLLKLISPDWLNICFKLRILHDDMIKRTDTKLTHRKCYLGQTRETNLQSITTSTKMCICRQIKRSRLNHLCRFVQGDIVLGAFLQFFYRFSFILFDLCPIYCYIFLNR